MPFVGDLVIDSTLTDLGIGVVLDTWREVLGFGYVEVMYFNECGDAIWSPVEQIKVISKGHGDESW